jgi:Abnormal spindle-like microcephaly-assoc'd, ASPM-SPD-2-Hydin
MRSAINGSSNETQVGSRRTPNFRSALTALLLALLIVGFTAGCTNMSGNTQTPAAPSQQLSLQFSPPSLNFGTVASGKKISQSASVTNTGTSNATIAQIISSNNQFATSGLTFPLVIAPSQTVNFMVWFNGAMAPGKNAGTLTFQSSDGQSTATSQIAVTATEVTPQPQLVVSPASLDAGSATVGSKTTTTLTLSNTGTADLNVSVLTIAGTEFSIAGISTPATIPAGQSAPLSVIYAPKAAGSDTGSITVTSNDPSSQKKIALSGTATNAPVGHLTLNPSTLTFGNVSVGSSSVLNATVTNSGQGVVHISQVFASGAGYTESGIATPATLAAGQSAQVKVTFAPTASGLLGGTVGISSDAPGAAPGLAMTGTGVQPALSVSPASISFGSLIDGQSKSQSVTVTNTGTADLKISQMTAAGTGMTVSGITTPLTIPAAQSSTFKVQFAPQTAGASSGSISLTSNASSSATVIGMSGTGVASTSTLSLSPSSLSFGNVNVGSSANQTVTVTNTGNSSATISQIGVTGSGLSLTGISTPLTLAPSQSTLFTVVFNPSTTAATTGSVAVVSQSGTSQVSVTGSGAQAALSLSQNAVTFNNVTTGISNSQPLQISNTGNATLTVSQANVTGSGFSISGLTLPANISAGQNASFTVVFLPQTAGSVTGTLSLVSNASSSPSTVSLTGSSTAATHTLSVSASSFSFGSVNAGSSASKSVTLTNTGNASVTVSQVSITGTNFALVGAGAPITLSAGQSTMFSVQFSPAGAESDNGSVSITSNATGSPAAIALSGTGVAQQVQHNVQLSWTDSGSGLAGYNVYRSTTSGSGYVLLNGALVPTDGFTDSTVQSGTTYFYVTTAVDGTGTESSHSNEAQAIVP